jgi:hypothetical protein
LRLRPQLHSASSCPHSFLHAAQQAATFQVEVCKSIVSVSGGTLRLRPQLHSASSCPHSFLQAAQAAALCCNLAVHKQQQVLQAEQVV